MCVLLGAHSFSSHADEIESEVVSPATDAPPLDTETACAATPRETPLDEKISSAGIMYNLAEHPKSIRAVAAKLLAAALDSAAASSTAACVAGCAPAKSPEIVYRVSPVAFLPAANQQALCLTLERDTTQQPLTFPTQEFKSVEALNVWVMEFSQGRGVEGNKLYEQCGGNCSPRYTFLIAQGTDGLRLDTSVVCGLARDRASDDYTVSTALRNRCEVDSTPLASEPGAVLP